MGVAAYLSTITLVVWDSKSTHAVMNVQIEALKDADIQTGVEVKRLAAEQITLRTEYASVKVLLQTVNKSVEKLHDTAESLKVVTTELKAQRDAEKKE